MVASPHFARNVPYTNLYICSTTNYLNPDFQINKKSNHKVTFYGVLCLIIQLFLNPTEENNYMENKDKYPPPNPITYCLHICDLCQKMSFPCKVILTSHPCDVGNLSFFQKVLVDFNSC